ncbi:hypothetical protein PT974_10911 [Cladobotryum mycophilum]|uniref:RGS domain-containing protein n=1 Tax=Cladobotryum mycophilum TaxID=491253 RepID=A0ABR0SB47_9HYPO
MDPMADLTVYNVPPAKPNWDKVGVFYISWCVTWTTCLLCGMGFLWYHRKNPILKVRGLGLSFGAILFLHCYWILAQITYPIGATMPLPTAYSVQYFFMGIWFPLGVAMFHASNLRFLHVAKLQKQFTTPDVPVTSGCNGGHSSFLCKLRNLPYTRKIMVFIGSGMIFQVLLCVGMWVACLKYHPTFGIPGTGLTAKDIPGQLVQLGRGWEWWPSVVWQVIWTWIVAPYLIWRAWGIRDTMGWRTQTIGCCISSLHATPMFLIAQYVPAFDKVNHYFSPSQWIHLSLFMFEIFTVFVPIYLVIRFWMMQKKSADINAKWETASQSSTLRSSTTFDWKKHSSASLAEKGLPFDFADEEMGDRLLTMGALDHALTENPVPLQEFSALRDFSGENIAFLTRTAEWKSILPEAMSEQDRREAFNQALWIYVDFISPRDAEFPLNLSSHDLKDLEEIFERSARIVCGEARVNPATPFDFGQPGSSGSGSTEHKAGGYARHEELHGRVQFTGLIPPQFNPTVFDKAQSHVKYLVLTNTWPKFVAEMQSRRRSSETGRSIFTHTSETTLASRVSSKLSNLIRSML